MEKCIVIYIYIYVCLGYFGFVSGVVCFGVSCFGGLGSVALRRNPEMFSVQAGMLDVSAGGCAKRSSRVCLCTGCTGFRCLRIVISHRTMNQGNGCCSKSPFGAVNNKPTYAKMQHHYMAFLSPTSTFNARGQGES